MGTMRRSYRKRPGVKIARPPATTRPIHEPIMKLRWRFRKKPADGVPPKGRNTAWMTDGIWAVFLSAANTSWRILIAESAITKQTKVQRVSKWMALKLPSSSRMPSEVRQAKRMMPAQVRPNALWRRSPFRRDKIHTPSGMARVETNKCDDT